MQGESVEALTGRLECGAQAKEESKAEYRPARDEATPVTSAITQNSKKPLRIKPAKQNKPARKLVSRREKSPTPQEITTLGALFKERKYTEAATLAQNMTELYPANGISWKVLGGVFMQMGRSADALEPMQKAAALSPGDAEAHSNLGSIFRKLAQFDAAEASCRRALEINPDFAEAHNNLGNILLNLGRLDAAEASCRRALEINPDFAEAHSNLGNALYSLGHLDEAEASHRRALEIKPDLAEALSNLGVALSDSGKADEAVACYRRALERKPNWAILYFNLHPLLISTGDMAAAVKCMEKAVEFDPYYAGYRFFLGMILDYTGNPDAAKEHFDKVERSTALHRARLDAWRYLKSVSNKPPLMTGSNIQAFKIGINSAVNDGLIMEFGVRFGSSIRQIAALVDGMVHGFDSFEGLPEQWHHEPQGSYSTKGVIPNVPGNVALYAGWFEDTLPAFLKNHAGPARFINIDCDLYSSTITVLDLLADRIISGTVIIFDEYIANEHWRVDEFKAFQEAVAKYNWVYEYICFSFTTKQVVIRIVRVG